MRKSIIERDPEEMINVKGRWRTPEEIEEEEDREAEALGKALLADSDIDWEEEELMETYRLTARDLLSQEEQDLLEETANYAEGPCEQWHRHFEECFRLGLTEKECARRWMARAN